MSGASSLTVMLTVALTEPPLLLAEIVNVLSVINDVGVPQMVPLLVPKDKPLGKAGLMAHDTNSPEPVMVGESGRSLLAVLLVKSKSFGEYAIVGTSSLTSMVMVVVSTPPLFLTVIVYVVLVDNSVGVPEISPVLISKLNPAGKAGLME